MWQKADAAPKNGVAPEKLTLRPAGSHTLRTVFSNTLRLILSLLLWRVCMARRKVWLATLLDGMDLSTSGSI
jgi:hypothetical protein